MSRAALGDVAIECKEILKGSRADHPIVGLEHLTPKQITLTAWGNDSGSTFSKVFHRGQVLFGRRRAYLKKAAVAPFDGLCSGDITVIEAKAGLILPELLPFVIQNDAFFDYAVGRSAGSLSPRVKWEHLKKYEFELPDMSEQKKLAELLWSMVEAKEAYQELLRRTDELVKSQFVTTFGNGTDVKKEWPLIRLEELCSSIVRGPFGSALKVNYFVPKSSSSVKVYEQKNAIQASAELGDSYIPSERFQELRRFECGPGDFIMSCSGTIGCLYQLPDYAEPGIINQALCKFRLNEKILPEVFSAFMRQSVDQLETKGSAMKNIGAVSYIKNMAVPLAPLNIQRNFADFTRQSNKSKSELEQAMKALEATYNKVISEHLG